MSSSSNGKSDSGVNIALAGLAIQVATLAAFSALCIDYFILSRSVWMSTRWPTRFLVFVSFLVSATILILIRCCYRVYELSEGYSRTSSALRDEGLFIALESVMVVIAASCLVAAHPGFVFQTCQERLKPDAGFSEKQLRDENISSESTADSATRI